MSSPVPTLLRTHIVPSSPETKLIRSILPHVLSNIAVIDGEVDRVQALLDSLKHKHRGLEIYAEEHESLLAPVNCLPPGLLAKVFMDCISLESNPASAAGKRNIMCPFDIADTLPCRRRDFGHRSTLTSGSKNSNPK
jgi:hypothetical protein